MATEASYLAATSLTGVAGQALTGSLTFTDSTATSMTVQIKGVPAGMSFAPSGTALTVKWASPMTGSYPLQVTATDSQNLTATATIPVTISAH